MTCFLEPEWSQWSIFTACSKSCGKGTQTRSRTCKQFGGNKNCIGNKKESATCEIIECQKGKHPLLIVIVTNCQFFLLVKTIQKIIYFQRKFTLKISKQSTQTIATHEVKM